MLERSLRYPLRWFFVIATGMLALDQIIKILQRSLMALGTTITVIPGLFYLRSIMNRGAAFSILEGQIRIFYLVAVVMAVFLLVFWLYEHPRTVLPVASTALIAAGGVGNLIDRVLFGGVYDLINVTFFPFAVFNIADLCMTVGVIAFAVWFIFFDGLASLSEHRGDGSQ
jgi:signal peptidase II